ncbi:MAG: ABC transporter transmembrane domain-containing protein, partial [Lentisphaeria bacterium]
MKAFFRDMVFLFSRRDILRFLLLVCLLVVGTGIELISLAAVPIFVGILTRSGGETVLMQQLQHFFQHFGWGDYAFQLRLSSLFFLALFAFRTLYLYGSYSLQERILNNRCVELGSRIFSAYMSASYRFLLQRNSQDLVKSVVVDSDRVVNRVLGPLINLLRSLIVMFGVVIMLLIYTPLITGFALFSLLLFAGGYLYWNRQNTRRHGEADAENRKVAMAAVAEGIGGFKEIQVGGCKIFFITRLHRALEKICASQRWLSVSQLIMWPYLELVTISVLVVSTLMALGFAQQNFSAIAPVMALFAVALFRLKGYVTDCMLNYTMLRYNLVSVNLVCRDLRTLQQENFESCPRRSDGQVALPFQKNIHIEKVDF